jgi:hypothetical protein
MPHTPVGPSDPGTSNDVESGRPVFLLDTGAILLIRSVRYVAFLLQKRAEHPYISCFETTVACLPKAP